MAHAYCKQTAGRIKIPFGTEVGLGPGHIVLDGILLLLSQRGKTPPQFSAHVCCGQTAGWEVSIDLGPGHIVLDGDQAPPPPKGHSPQLLVHVYCGPTVAHLSYCRTLVILPLL